MSITSVPLGTLGFLDKISYAVKANTCDPQLTYLTVLIKPAEDHLLSVAILELGEYTNAMRFTRPAVTQEMVPDLPARLDRWP